MRFSRFVKDKDQRFTFWLPFSVPSVCVRVLVQTALAILVIQVIATYFHNLFRHLEHFSFWTNTNSISGSHPRSQI